MDEDFYLNVCAIVQEIPIGCVATYQLIAKLAGRAKNSRLVGRALRYADQYGDFPCHRVVHADGCLVVDWDEQRALLEAEGITFLANGKVDLANHLWQCGV